MTRQRLRHRRASETLGFEYGGHRYRATVSRFADGQIAEIFLDTGKAGSAVQEYAENAAILASRLLQHGVTSDEIACAVTGPISEALKLFAGRLACEVQR